MIHVGWMPTMKQTIDDSGRKIEELKLRYRSKSAGTVPRIVMEVDTFEATQPTQSGRGETLDEIAVQSEPLEQFEALKGAGFDVTHLRIGHFEPDELRHSGQRVVGQSHQRIAVQLQLTQLRNVFECGAGHRRQHVVTQVQFHQVGKTHERTALDQSHRAPLQDDALQVQQPQPLEQVSAELHQRIAAHVQHLHRRVRRERWNFSQPHLRAQHALLAIAPFALALARARRRRRRG